MNNKMLRFHYEEIIYVLMILATNLKDYSDDDLKGFAEAIHRLDILSKPDFLKDLRLINPKIDDETVSSVVALQSTVAKLYSGQWYKELADKGRVLNKSNTLSRQLLQKLDEDYVEPIAYANQFMNVDW